MAKTEKGHGNAIIVLHSLLHIIVKQTP